jgi:hypothetical protein
LAEVVLLVQHHQQEVYKVRILVSMQLLLEKILGVKVAEAVAEVLQQILLVHVLVVRVVLVVEVLNVMAAVEVEHQDKEMLVVLVVMDPH